MSSMCFMISLSSPDGRSITELVSFSAVNEYEWAC